MLVKMGQNLTDLRIMPRHIAFCLCPGLPLLPLASALEVLRHANRFAQYQAYRWTLLCEHDRPVRDSNAIRWYPSAGLNSIDTADLAMVVAGSDAAQLETPRLGAWLARLAARGKPIGALSNGAFLLAALGLLDGHDATTHWEDFESFYLAFPRVRARYRRVVIDRNRITCAGGSATLDLFCELVRQDLGERISQRISRQMLLRGDPLGPGFRPFGSQPDSSLSPAIQRALGLIESGVEEGVNVTRLAQKVGLGRRDLLRKFRAELNTTPSALLSQRRLERARALILNTRLPMAAIAASVGYSSQSHLTTNYRDRFGITPARQRRDYLRAHARPPLREGEYRDW